MKRKVVSILLCAVMVSSMLAGCGSSSKDTAKSDNGEKQEETTEVTELSVLWVGDGSLDGIQAVSDEAEKQLGIKVDIENLGGGEDADNVVKTRLASGDMADILCYNTGSLFTALNPSEYFEDLSSEGFASTLDDTFKESASDDGKLYGIPSSATQIGAVLYNKTTYEENNLSVPKTWDEFMQNCETLKAAGETAVLGTFGDSWTSQVPYLGDYYNLEAANPEFAEKFEAGEAKYATDPAGLKSFQKMEDLIPYYNSDYLATSYDDGCEMLAEGEAAQWIMLSSALSNIYSLYGEDVNDIGCFAIPGDDADNCGLTVWEPNGLYANKDSDKLDDIKKFFEFYVSSEGLDVYTSAQLPYGPYAVSGYELPDDCYAAVKDMQTYFDAGKTCVALEFKTAVKGANCAAICQELGSGQTKAKEAAEKYDQDCEKQAKQLGLDW